MIKGTRLEFLSCFAALPKDYFADLEAFAAAFLPPFAPPLALVVALVVAFLVVVLAFAITVNFRKIPAVFFYKAISCKNRYGANVLKVFYTPNFLTEFSSTHE